MEPMAPLAIFRVITPPSAGSNKLRIRRAQFSLQPEGFVVLHLIRSHNYYCGQIKDPLREVVSILQGNEQLVGHARGYRQSLAAEKITSQGQGLCFGEDAEDVRQSPGNEGEW